MATFIVKCFGSVADCFYGTGEWRPPQPIPASKPIPEVILDTSTMGQEAVVVKNGSRLCGTGAARSSAPILQNKAYWECKLQQSGVWSCGLANPSCDLTHNLGCDANSWAITHNNAIKINGHIEHSIDQKIQEGDTIGFSYDHVELNIYLNGENLNCPIYGIKGTVYPVFFVDDGAIIDAVFESFQHGPPSGFDRIMVEKALL